MSTHASPKIAIIGSGPAGCYLAQSLVRGAPDARLTLIDRLASPFGLIRYGVAADHQHTKAITRQFERLFQSSSVRFAGNVEIGRDLSLEELAEQYDAVVLATGLSVDRPLGVPGDGLPGVIGAGEITRTLNAHPDEGLQLPTLGSTPVIIGAGNVAIDILRFLVKDREGFEGSDVSDSALDAYLAAPADRITLVSRSSAAESKGDPQMLKELATLPRATYTSPDDLTIDPEAAPDRTATARVAAIADMVSADRSEHPGPHVTLRFGLRPVRILGNERVEGVEFASGDETIVVPATSVLTAIGFSAFADDQLAELVAEHSEIGRIEPGLYRTGWAKRGPRGAIPENRACAKSVADEILADLADGSLKVSSEKAGFTGLPEAVRARAVDYDHWLVLDAHERAHAPAGRIRRKIADHDQMTAVARGEHE